MNRRLMWTGAGVALCAAVLVTTLALSPAHEPTAAQIVVPLEQDPTPETPIPPSSTVSVLLPAPPVAPPASTTPPATSQTPKPPTPLPKPVVTAPFTFGGLDLQAEIARIRNGRVEAEHSGFTGLGYVNYDAVAGSSVEWSVTAPGPASPDVVFRFANGSAQTRPMAISVNGTLVRTVGFPPTGAWNRWQTLTVHTDLPVGTNTIRATATTGDGGPNLDKITLV